MEIDKLTLKFTGRDRDPEQPTQHGRGTKLGTNPDCKADSDVTVSETAGVGDRTGKRINGTEHRAQEQSHIHSH